MLAQTAELTCMEQVTWMPLGGHEIEQACKVLKLKRPSNHRRLPQSAPSSPRSSQDSSPEGHTTAERSAPQPPPQQQPTSYREGEWQVGSLPCLLLVQDSISCELLAPRHQPGLPGRSASV